MCAKMTFYSWIEPVFSYGMCIDHIRSNAKFPLKLRVVALQIKEQKVILDTLIYAV